MNSKAASGTNMIERMRLYFDTSMKNALEYLADGSLSWKDFVDEFDESIYVGVRDVFTNTIVDVIDDNTDEFDSAIGKIVDTYLDMTITYSAKMALETGIEVSNTSIEVATHPKSPMLKKNTEKALNKVMNAKIKKMIKESIVDDIREAMFDAVSNAVADAIQRRG